MIIGKIPEQLKLDHGLWTRKAVKEPVKREFGVVSAINTMGITYVYWVSYLKSLRKKHLYIVLKK
jgi:hypothetical protein